MFPSLRARCDAARRDQQLFFAALLAPETIREVFGEASEVLDSARIYTTAVTVWTFLAQVLSAHHGCVDAVLRLIAFRVARGQSACSARTGAYCLARDQLDEAAMHRLVTHTGRQIEAAVPAEWRWHGQRVVVADGTTLTMADTPANQREYPQLSRAGSRLPPWGTVSALGDQCCKKHGFLGLLATDESTKAGGSLPYGGSPASDFIAEKFGGSLPHAQRKS